MSLLLRRRALAVVIPPTAQTFNLAPGYRYSAKVDGKLIFFDDLRTLESILRNQKWKAKRKIVRRAAAKFRKGAEVAIPEITPVEAPEWAVTEIQSANVALAIYFWEQVQRLFEQDDEDAILYG